MSYPNTPQNSDPSNNANTSSPNPYTQPPAAPQYGQQAPQYGQPVGDYGAPGAYNQQGYGPGYPSNNLGGWALGLSIGAFFLSCLPLSIAAIVLGSKAKRAVSEGRANNGGMASAGIILGWVGIAVGIIVVAVIIWLASNAGGMEQFLDDWLRKLEADSAAA